MTRERIGRHSHRRRTYRRVALLLVWIFSWAVPAFSQAASHTGLHLEQVELVDTGQGKLVSLQFSQPPDALKSFALGSPPRVVIDVQGPIRPLASARYAAQDSLIRRVRVGFHKQYIRFVLDLKKGVIPPFSVEQKQDLVIASLQVSGQASPDAPAQILFSHSGATRKTRAVAELSQTSRTEPAAPPTAPATPTSQPAVQAARTPEPIPPPTSPPQTAPASRLFLPGVRPPTQTRASRSTGSSAQADSKAAVPRLLPGASLLRPSTSPQTTRKPFSLLSPSVAGRQPSAVPAPSVSRTSRSRTPATPAQSKRPRRQLAAISPKDALSRPPKKTPSPPSLSREARRHLGKGQILYDQGKVAEAIVEWRETARLAPTNAKAHHLLGLALQDQGNTEEAVGKLQTSVRLDPANATAYVHLAQALESKGDSKGALGAYNKALKLVPTSAHVHNRLGHLLASQGDWQGAANEWQHTTELQPDYAYAYANLGEALEQIEQKKEALEAYKQAVILDPAAPFAAEVRKRIVRLSTDAL